MKKIICLLILSSLFTMCTKDDDSVKINTEILGEYEFVTYKSNIPLDLDFDNLKDEELLNEFDYWKWPSERDAKVWETHNTLNREYYYYVSLNNFPRVDPFQQWIENRLYSNASDVVFFNIEKNNIVSKFKSEMTNYPKKGEYFLTTNFEILPNKNLKVNGKQEFFDYQESKWVEVEIEAILVKKTDK